ncbi:uncharacterized protein knl1 isoform X1 [Mugil cephalus]|uniref:uncharacterized protein knl1 isoform X1 n=1 Tax=Mugil cephalus TaxID=48193 RepID=UPI001FB84A7A|nr:uncharacterized protein knl1 isoform X1 [Mugil cephalus]
MTTPPAGPSSLGTNTPLAQNKTQRAVVDKENLAPQPRNTTRKIRESSYGGPLCPGDETNMDMTEAQTGRILGVDDDDDPFQCLFPTQEMYAHADKRASQTTKANQSSKMLGSTNPKERKSLINPPLPALHQRQKVGFDAKDERRDKTIIFTADDEFMDMTQSHTVNIASGPTASEKMPVNSSGFLHCKPVEPSGKPVSAKMKPAVASSSKESANTNNSLFQMKTPRTHVGEADRNAVCPKDDVSMDMTETQTGRIIGLNGSDDPFQFLFPSQEMYDQSDGLKKADMSSVPQSREARKSLSQKGLETSLKSSFKKRVQIHQEKLDSEDDYRERTVRFSADDGCMDVTRSHTVNISTDLKLHSSQNLDFLPTCGEKTVRFDANDAAMDMTQCLTVNIASNLVSDLPVKKPEGETCGPPPNMSSLSRRSMSSDGGTFCPEDNVSMDMTEAQTGRIMEISGPDDPLQCLFPTQGMYAQSGNLTSHQQTSGPSDSKGMETMLKPIKTRTPRRQDKPGSLDERTVRFSADDGCMDVTRSHTVNISTDLKLNGDFLPTCGEKTVRFNANDAAMDMTQCLTVNIASNLVSDLPVKTPEGETVPPSSHGWTVCPEDDVSMDMTEAQTGRIMEISGADDPLQCLFPTQGMYAQSGNLTSHQQTSGPSNSKGVETSLKTSLKTKVQRPQVKFDAEDDYRERTVRFSADDACMDVTQSHTVNIMADLQLQSHQNVDFIPTSGEKTVRFTSSDAAVDVTRSHTVNIATALEPNVDSMPTCKEKTVRSNANEAVMDMTQSLTVNINSDVASHAVPSHENVLPISENAGLPSTCNPRRNRSSSGHGLLSKTSALWTDPDAESTDTPFPQETTDTNQLETQISGMKTEREASRLVSGKTDGQELNASMDMTEAQTGYILEQTCTEEPPECYSSDEHIKKMTSSHCNEPETKKETESTTTLSQKMESSPSAADQDVDHSHPRKSRRMSLADLQTKIRRLSHMINAAPDAVPLESCTAPLPNLSHDLDGNSKDKTTSPSEVEPQLEMSSVNVPDEAQCLREDEQISGTTTAPFSLKTNQLMSRLSMGGFKPKLPERSKSDESKKLNTSEHTKTVNLDVSHQMSNTDNDVSDIFDEELGSCEDMSEALDIRSPQKLYEKETVPSQDLNVDEPLDDNVFEENAIRTGQGRKRPLPEDDTFRNEDEKRMNTTTEMVEMALQSAIDRNITAARMTSHTIDSSNSSHTASMRCEAAFESTFKHSMFESQLEDYGSEVQKQLEDGSITVLEFFKLFSIDFVIHNPRQSVLPGRLMSETDTTPMDALKDRHVHRPKQTVYESDVLTLTEKVEGLKVRLRDLDKPLKAVNRPLWEEMKCSSEKELKSFGSKLKERNNFFRKTSKVQSHEMKEVLYSNLVQANLEEQQKLKGTLEEADAMIKSLDDCIRELETELAAVEEKGSENKPSLKSLREEMNKVTETLADNERQISELEMQKKQNSSDVNRMKAETRNLEIRLDMLNMLNEWKLKDMRDDCTIFTFLHETMYLQVEFEKSPGDDAGVGCERRIAHISFKFELDDEQSWSHARLVHNLVSQYIEGESAWVEKYPTSRHLPMLLNDVSLVVSRCRLLGEEIRLLKMWGGLRLDILDISCTDSNVRIIFSSLRTFSKFEVIFAVSLTNELCVLQVESFKNLIGSTTIQQIEEIVASFTPGKKLLTKIVKKIHDALLC